MSDSVTRISLDAALDDDRTDWVRVRGLSDAAVDAAMADDPDSFGLPRSQAQGAFYQIYQDGARGWRWRLVAADRRIMAESAAGYASRAAVSDALNETRLVMGTREVRAA